MFVPREEARPHPDWLVCCPGCGWRSRVRHADCHENDAVRCPECGKAVERETEAIK
jgi:hypothetical protein